MAIFNGTPARDYLTSTTGNDTLNGGEGTDTAIYGNATGPVTVNLALGTAFGAGVGFDTLISIEDIYGSSFADTLTGDSNSNFIDGSKGNDLIRGAEGSDQLQGGDGNDTLDGGADTDTVFYFDATGSVTVNLAMGFASGAGIGFDTLISIENVNGSSYADTLIGDFNNNTFSGLGGQDTLTGGGGADTFNILSGGKSPPATSTDTILDFTVGNGPDADQIYLNPGYYSSNYIRGSNPFSSGHLQLTQLGADTLVNLDSDGSARQGGLIIVAILKNVTKSALTANNFGGFDPNVTFAPTPTSYTVTPSGASVNEGSSVTYTVNTTGVTSSMVLGYQLTGVSTSDVVGGNLTGNITIGANGQGSVTISLAADQQTEGNENLVLSLLNGGIVVGTAALVAVVDTSTAALTPVLPPVGPTDDFVVLQTSTPAVAGAGVGNDTYLLSGSMIPAGKAITISDAQGANSIQLASGLQIASAQVGATALKLNLTSGASITVLGADRFTFEAGGNTTAGIDQPDLSYSQFVQSVLGVSVPITGLVTSGAITIGGGSVSAINVSGNQAVSATAEADVFSFNAVSARLDATGTNTQAIISGFSTTNDRLLIDLPIANSSLTSLNQLNGVQGVLVQLDPFTGATLISFGNDANGGELVALTLVGVSDPAAVQIQVV